MTEDRNKQILDELEVYVAYGRYSQAVKFIENALLEIPGDAELEARLAELKTLAENSKTSVAGKVILIVVVLVAIGLAIFYLGEP